MNDFQKFLIDRGHIQAIDLQRASELQGQNQDEFGRICLQRKIMTVKQVMEVLKKQATMGVNFGSLAVICGYLKEDQRKEISRQLPAPLSVEQALVKLGVITSAQLRNAKQGFESGAQAPVAPTVAVASKAPEGSRTVALNDLMALSEDAVAEIREDIEGDLSSLEALLLGDLSANPEGFGAAAFHANRIRGAATVREIPWLPEVAKAIEEFCLQSQSNPPKNWSQLSELLFQGTDAIRAFVESLGREEVKVDQAWCERLKSQLHRSEQVQVTQENVNAALHQQASQAPVAPGKALAGKRMMVVDDNKLVRKSLQNVFVSHGAVVETAEHGADGVAKLEAAGGFDLLVVDIHMPVMDGFGLVEHVRKSPRFESTPVVMFTASLSMEDVRRARDLRVDGYLLKNAPKTELLGKVAAVLAKR